jgi:hypothetical protein
VIALHEDLGRTEPLPADHEPAIRELALLRVQAFPDQDRVAQVQQAIDRLMPAQDAYEARQAFRRRLRRGAR